MVLLVGFIYSCSPQKIAQPTETSQIEIAKDIKKIEQPKERAPLGDEMKDSAPKEVISEKELARIEPAEIKPAEKDLQIKISDIYFDFDQYDIKEDAKPIIKDVASMLLKNNKWKVIIEGHCDERGTNEYNLALGEKRANSVKQYLIALGIPSSRISTVSYGEERPLCTEQTEECWAKNRRAHFVFVEASK
jgi:peptidoglycan-associated lipoprotein